MILSLMMYVFGFTQLSSIHLGHDRNFTMLMYNENATRVRAQHPGIISKLNLIRSDRFYRSMATSVLKMC